MSGARYVFTTPRCGATCYKPPFCDETTSGQEHADGRMLHDCVEDRFHEDVHYCLCGVTWFSHENYSNGPKVEVSF